MKVLKGKKLDEIIYFAADSGNRELSADFMPVTKAYLEKYKEEDITNIRTGQMLGGSPVAYITNIRTGQMLGGSPVKIGELHVTNVESAYIEAETMQENPVFFYGISKMFVMAVTNPQTTGSNVVVKKPKTIN